MRVGYRKRNVNRDGRLGHRKKLTSSHRAPRDASLWHTPATNRYPSYLIHEHNSYKDGMRECIGGEICPCIEIIIQRVKEEVVVNTFTTS